MSFWKNIFKKNVDSEVITKTSDTKSEVITKTSDTKSDIKKMKCSKCGQLVEKTTLIINPDNPFESGAYCLSCKESYMRTHDSY